MPFTNRNFCKTFNLSLTTSTLGLTAQECSEVVVVSTVSTTYYDHMNPSVGFIVPANVEFTFRGLTNSNQLSAKGATTGTLYYRTQYFSFMPGV
jgi:hypothetical protein